MVRLVNVLGEAGWRRLVARWAHNPQVTGSNPVPATMTNEEVLALAQLILGQQVRCEKPWHAVFPKPSCWQCGRNGAFHRSARLVLSAATHPRVIPGSRRHR